MFTALKLTLDGDGALNELLTLDPSQWQRGDIEEMIILEDATNLGYPAVMLKIQCSDGTIVIAETTGRLLNTAVNAARARYGEDET